MNSDNEHRPSIARAAFKLQEGSRLTDELNISLKRGDMLSVEHPPRSRKNELLRDTVRFSVGTYLNPDDLWDDD